MIVIIEGVDGSGKSTLVRQLVEEGYRATSIESHREEEYSKWCKAYKEAQDDVVVTDRSFVTDLVYRMFDGKERRGMDLLGMSLILNSDVKIVFCESGTEFDDSMTRGEDNITRREDNEAIALVYRVVKNLIKSFTDSDVFVYDWHTMSVSDVINFIKERR